MSRRGLTLLEVAIGASVAALVLGILLEVAFGASRMLGWGEENIAGRRAALLLFHALEKDLHGAVQIPGDPRPPVARTRGGGMAFYRAELPTSLREPVLGRPVRWELEPAAGGRKVPVRNGRRLEGIQIEGWELSLSPPSADDARAGWFLLARVRVGTTRWGDPVIQARSIRLPQPSQNFLHFPSFPDVIPGQVRVLPPPEPEDPGVEDAFARLRPPRVAVLSEEGAGPEEPSS